MILESEDIYGFRVYKACVHRSDSLGLAGFWVWG